jgi:hypothetical protein
VLFRRQLPSAEHSRGSGGAGEPIEAFGKFQDCFPRAGIGQLPGHLPRLFGAVKPFPCFIHVHAYSLDKAMKMYARIRSLDQVAAMLWE